MICADQKHVVPAGSPICPYCGSTNLVDESRVVPSPSGASGSEADTIQASSEGQQPTATTADTHPSPVDESRIAPAESGASAHDASTVPSASEGQRSTSRTSPLVIALLAAVGIAIVIFAAKSMSTDDVARSPTPTRPGSAAPPGHDDATRRREQLEREALRQVMEPIPGSEDELRRQEELAREALRQVQVMEPPPPPDDGYQVLERIIQGEGGGEHEGGGSVIDDAEPGALEANEHRWQEAGQ